jgi:diguanylate cyclase (GGDEF)-like protein
LLLRTVRHGDAVFRMGGDEFALLLEHCAAERALEVVDRIVERLEAERDELPVGASFGVAVADCSEPVDSDALLRRADDAMYDAKGSRAVLRLAA